MKKTNAQLLKENKELHELWQNACNDKAGLEHQLNQAMLLVESGDRTANHFNNSCTERERENKRLSDLIENNKKFHKATLELLLGIELLIYHDKNFLTFDNEKTSREIQAIIKLGLNKIDS